MENFKNSYIKEYGSNNKYYIVFSCYKDRKFAIYMSISKIDAENFLMELNKWIFLKYDNKKSVMGLIL